MIRALAAVTLLTVSCVENCSEPLPGVVVTHNANQYVVSIRDCRGRFDMPVLALSVSKIQKGTNSPELQCELKSLRSNKILERWDYGVAPQGYKIASCLPLESGASYEIDVDARPRSVKGHFVVQPDGEVTMLDGDCKH